MLNRLNYDDTIAAISTPIGIGGIGIVRLSGQDAIKLADKIFVSKNGKKLAQLASHKVCFGKIIDDDKIIDEALVTLMRAPKTYTKEDIVEINCHGGIIVTKEILNLLTKCGARLAEPGEFTMRAFLNGRIDLVQAEAILDIIEAKTKDALDLSLNNLRGSLSKKINTISKNLFELLTNLEAEINFPEENDVKGRKQNNTFKKIDAIFKDVLKLVNTFDCGRIIKEGVKTVICGKANVGKSSLLNALLEKNRSIVSEIPGTTRDTIEETVNFDGVLLKITDTAGLIKPKDKIEEEALKRSKEAIKEADIVFLVVDGSRQISKEDLFFIELLKDKQFILVINKNDLPKKVDLSVLKLDYQVSISALKKKNLGRLKKIVKDLVFSDKIVCNEEVIVTNIRQAQALRDGLVYLENAFKSAKENLSLEFIAQDLKDALNKIDSITGKDSNSEILNNIFSKFCIGK
ncbi:MAG: tRNA uridine-5-carboxymethylaminomethyl(34) synthesis GTPase MnmE [Candidatus Omnitrophota bacterium]